MGWETPHELPESGPHKRTEVHLHPLDFDRVRAHIIDIHKACGTDMFSERISDFFLTGILEVLRINPDVPMNYSRFIMLPSDTFTERKLTDVYPALEDKSKRPQAIEKNLKAMMNALKVAREQGLIKW